MTPREIIRRNLDFTGPERFGFQYGGYQDAVHDFCSAGLGPSPTYEQRRWVEGNMEYYDDQWGNVWFRIVDMGKGGEIYQPALEDWAQLQDYELPDLTLPERYEKAREAFAAQPDLYHVGGVPGFPFAICRYLRKMEVYFQDLMLERENIDELHDRVTTLLEGVMRRYAEAGADGVMFCEDWGTQERLLVSPEMWREIFKPLFKRLCGTAHECGMHVLMHSCGYNWAILDDLAEVGVNAFQFDQPHIYGIERLAEKLQGLRVCLYSPVDIQQILPTGDKNLIVSEARKMVRLFSGEHGGLIVKNYGDLPGIGVETEWDRWAYDAFLEAAGMK